MLTSRLDREHVDQGQQDDHADDDQDDDGGSWGGVYV